MIGRNAFSIRHTAQAVFEDSPISMTAVAKLNNDAPAKVCGASCKNQRQQENSRRQARFAGI
jgi:hypothetical protein